MDYILITLGMVAFIVGVLVLLARAYPGSGSDLVDWKPTRDYETEIQLEQDDIAQMIAAQNDYRRRRGAPRADRARRRADGPRGPAGAPARSDGRGVAGEARSRAPRHEPDAAREELGPTRGGGAGAARRVRLPRPRARPQRCATGAGRFAGRPRRPDGLEPIESAGLEAGDRRSRPGRDGARSRRGRRGRRLADGLGIRARRRSSRRSTCCGSGACSRSWSTRRCGGSSSRAPERRARRCWRPAPLWSSGPARTWMIPVRVVTADRDDGADGANWVAAMSAATLAVLTG